MNLSKTKKTIISIYLISIFILWFFFKPTSDRVWLAWLYIPLIVFAIVLLIIVMRNDQINSVNLETASYLVSGVGLVVANITLYNDIAYLAEGPKTTAIDILLYSSYLVYLISSAFFIYSAYKLFQYHK